ncbi:uncharacterized protein PHACADRAFT_262092, partial [Phanerochaete carnosa HHB-10118-sp]
MLLRLAIILAATTRGLAAILATATAVAPFASTIFSCYADYCPDVELKKEALISM